MGVIVRNLESTETLFLKEMLYEALYVPDGEPPFDKRILESPELKKYYADWGKETDFALVASEGSLLIGACWYRSFAPSKPGYGFVSESIPELTMAVIKEYRGRGIGTQLLEGLLDSAKKSGLSGLSLSVDRNNPAYYLYLRTGFRVVKEEGNPTMVHRFD